MGSEYLTALKKAKFDVLETKTLGIHDIQGVKWLYGDRTALQKKEKDYDNAIFTY